MILDPDGMFNGDRVARLSLEARLHLPFYMLAANDYGRLELNFHRLVNRIFARFPASPSEEQIWSHFGEYAEQHLGYVYEAGGQPWVQFDTSEKWLPRYKSKASQASPDPGPAFIEWKSEYSRLKQEALQAKPIPLTGFKNSPQIFGKVSHGIGVGVGVGVGIGSSSTRAKAAPTLLAADGLPLTLAAARTHFPSVNGAFLTKLAQSVVSAGIEASDEQIAAALRETYRADQRTPNLWLTTAVECLGKPDLDGDFDPIKRNREILGAEEKASAEWRVRLAREQESQNGGA